MPYNPPPPRRRRSHERSLYFPGTTQKQRKKARFHRQKKNENSSSTCGINKSQLCVHVICMQIFALGTVFRFFPPSPPFPSWGTTARRSFTPSNAPVQTFKFCWYFGFFSSVSMSSAPKRAALSINLCFFVPDDPRPRHRTSNPIHRIPFGL